MANTTKLALEASLKELLRTKPIDRITINDLTEHCGISRMTFYYHFKDIYDLVEWACVEDGKRALQDKKTYDTWLEGIAQIFEAVLENKPFIMNVYHAVAHEKVEQYLYKLTYELIVNVVEEKCKGITIADGIRRYLIKISVLLQIFINMDLWELCLTGSTRACRRITIRSL